MANKLIRLNPVSSASDAEGSFTEQKIIQPVTGMVDGMGIAIDVSEYIYIADFDRHVIFRARQGGDSVVFAGQLGTSGFADGQAGAARFDRPSHVAVPPSGEVYVVDSGNARIRRIDQNANVFTVAAIPAIGSDQIGGFAVTKSGTLYLIDNS
jgi:DNA-binding beta-propeller fold protein YncE